MMMLLILMTLVSMIIVYFIADKKGADVVFWVVMALLFGPLAIVFVLFVKPKTDLKE
ncbi:hypothetical protein [Hydrogenovibrio marinus]|uniref:hypothetical protein n=1 Tax=Hydrogenovibrio marinus TaxID=28885 RepID=UPI001259CF2D|nr:hypothetical protein [Hydrogenovibrio marinus]BBN59756.1 hypothetical protein HVMH_1350 [Hydrogenovibrio marinus]